MKIQLEIDLDKRTGFSTVIKKAWPFFISHSSHAFAMSALYINVLIISTIMWPGESFRSTEIGLLLGFTTYSMAVSGLFFGYLADHLSRIKLISISTVFFGIGLIFNGFAPQNLGFTTFVFFLSCTLMRGFFTGGFMPIMNSYVNDVAFEEERSQFLGALNGIFQIIQLIGMVFSAVMFQNYFWRAYFWIVGSIIVVLGVLILKGKEPKRASSQEELRDTLTNGDIIYNYRLNRETVKRTVFTPTNIIAFVEGVFTTILLSVPDFLLVAYVQSAPYNITPVSVSLFMIIFGVPGGILGVVLFAKISDRLAKRRSIKYRIYMIIFSLIGVYMVFIFVFFLPLPHLTVEQGNNLGILFSFPIIWILGLGALVGRSLGGLYSINQPPILQKINLPEAQGIIGSTNQFLELIGNGTGPILAGILLATFNQNYQMTIAIVMSIGIVGAIMWFLASFWIEKDARRISSILKKRNIELQENNGIHPINAINEC